MPNPTGLPTAQDGPRFSTVEIPNADENLNLIKLFKQQKMRRSRSQSICVKNGLPTAVQPKHSQRVSIWNNLSSSGSEEHATTAPKLKLRREESHSNSSIKSISSKTSLASAVGHFRNEFDELKCKMTIFGESLNICSCMAADFKRRLKHMEKRLMNLEKMHEAQCDTNTRRNRIYSAIIEKNKSLASKTKEDVRKLQNCKNESQMKETAGKICRNYLHGMWKTVDPTQLEVKRISGGLSNFLYYVALPDSTGLRRNSETQSELNAQSSCYTLYTDEPKKVLIRIYGQVHGERAMDAIVTESVLFTILSERRLGPKLHGVFSGGRIEEYIPARCLLTRELSEPALSMKIAEKMAAIHVMDVPLSKEPNWIWKTMFKWMKTVKEERFSTKTELTLQEADIMKTLRSIDFEKEVDWLKKFVATVDSPVVFCHNDLQEGNILLIEDEAQCNDVDGVMYMPSMNDLAQDSENPISNLEDSNTLDSVCSRVSDSGEPSIVFIDFEYCAYNYRGFDLANHFQEWGYDYTNANPPFYFENLENLPTLEQKEIFIKEYLKHYLSSKNEEKDQSPSIDDINHLLNEVEAFALVSHLFWTLWSIVNASKSQIPFGYWEYALSRAETYLKLKQEIMKKEQLGLPQKRKICEVDI